MEKKRLIADIPLITHCRIKELAARKNVSMAVWMMQAIAEKLAKEEKYE